MISKAISKIKTEMEKNKDNSYIQVVGGFLLQHLESNPESAEKILAEGKTVGKSLDEMRNVAQRKKAGNCAVLTDQEGFEVVLKYFGIEGTAPVPAAAGYQAPTQQVTTPQSAAVSGSDFDVRLEDLL